MSLPSPVPPAIRKAESLPVAIRLPPPTGSEGLSICPGAGSHRGVPQAAPTPSRHRRFLRELRTKTSPHLLEDAQAQQRRAATTGMSVTVVSTAVLTLTFFCVFLFLLYLTLFYAAPDAR